MIGLVFSQTFFAAALFLLTSLSAAEDSKVELPFFRVEGITVKHAGKVREPDTPDGVYRDLLRSSADLRVQFRNHSDEPIMFQSQVGRVRNSLSTLLEMYKKAKPGTPLHEGMMPPDCFLPAASDQDLDERDDQVDSTHLGVDVEDLKNRRSLRGVKASTIVPLCRTALRIARRIDRRVSSNRYNADSIRPLVEDLSEVIFAMSSQPENQ